MANVLEDILTENKVEKCSPELEREIAEFEETHKNGKGKFYTEDEMNTIVNEVLLEHV